MKSCFGGEIIAKEGVMMYQSPDADERLDPGNPPDNNKPLDDVKFQYYNTYEKWTKEDDEKLETFSAKKQLKN